MGRIQVLSDRVANQIAAGEVVERPASVCKELVENALDSGASRLRIELRGGGRSLIEVRDNGSGMRRDDAMLAFERHATSKLREADDLLSIATLGFRGEALPSIASVSRVLLRTRTADEESGTAVEIHGGRLRDVRDEALAPGTVVSVRNLFYNLPARRKFLRTEKTELAHTVRVATHYSLANLDKSIDLRNESGVLLAVTPVASLRERVYQVFGGNLLDRLVELDPVERQLPLAAARHGIGPETDAMRISGFVSEPQDQRRNRNSVYIFVNQRLVRDSLIQRAIVAGYEHLMPKGVFPFALVFLDIPPAMVDVNVHPAKTQVRFRSPSDVFDLVRDAIRERLIAAKPASGLPVPGTVSQDLPSGPARTGGTGAAPKPPFSLSGFSVQPGLPLTSRATSPVSPDKSGGASSGSLPNMPSQPTAATEGTSQGFVVNGHSDHVRAPLEDRGPTSLVDLSGLRLLGQIHDSFIVAEGDDGLWIIDQHVAHERILFEKVLSARLHDRALAQSLLEPIVLTLTPGQMVLYEEIAEEFRGNGFDIEPFGSRAVAVKAVPAELSPSQVESLLNDILDESRDRSDGSGLGELRKRMAATIACHAAIKINMPLTTEKMRWLLEELARSECPMSCPHGRPIALKYGTQDILKAFHRV